MQIYQIFFTFYANTTVKKQAITYFLHKLFFFLENIVPTTLLVVKLLYKLHKTEFNRKHQFPDINELGELMYNTLKIKFGVLPSELKSIRLTLATVAILQTVRIKRVKEVLYPIWFTRTDH